MRLPKEYQEVEYLESSDGNQYFSLNNTFGSPETYMEKTVCRVDCSSPDGSSSWLIGCRYNFGSRAFAISLNTNGSTYSKGCIYFNYGTQAKNPMPNLGEDYRVRTSITINKNHLYVNDTDYSSKYGYVEQPFELAGNFILFGGRNTQAGVIYKSIAGTRIYYVKIDNELSNDHIELIPCYRKSDSKPGMYDIVSGYFYTNLGTGEFLKGPNI